MHSHCEKAIFLLFFVLALSQCTPSPDAIVSEVELIEEHPISSQEELSSPVVSREAEATIDAIMDLKAYCLEAKKLEYYESFADKHGNALFAIIKAFSEDAPEGDVVTQYGTMMGKVELKQKGIFKYLLDEVNGNILKGKSIIKNQPDQGKFETLNQGPKMMLDYETLGLEDKPVYLFKLAVDQQHYQTTRHGLHQGDAGKALTKWIQSGTTSLYKRCVKDKITHQTMIQANKMAECTKACKEMIHADYLTEEAKKHTKTDLEAHKQEVLAPLPQSCRSGKWKHSPVACKWRAMAEDVIKAHCTATADAKMKAETKEVNLARIEMELQTKQLLKDKEVEDQHANAEKIVAQQKKVAEDQDQDKIFEAEAMKESKEKAAMKSYVEEADGTASGSDTTTEAESADAAESTSDAGEVATNVLEVLAA